MPRTEFVRLRPIIITLGRGLNALILMYEDRPRPSTSPSTNDNITGTNYNLTMLYKCIFGTGEVHFRFFYNFLGHLTDEPGPDLQKI